MSGIAGSVVDSSFRARDRVLREVLADRDPERRPEHRHRVVRV
jgi:hypothetical protein